MIFPHLMHLDALWMTRSLYKQCVLVVVTVLVSSILVHTERPTQTQDDGNVPTPTLVELKPHGHLQQSWSMIQKSAPREHKAMHLPAKANMVVGSSEDTKGGTKETTDAKEEENKKRKASALTPESLAALPPTQGLPNNFSQDAFDSFAQDKVSDLRLMYQGLQKKAEERQEDIKTWAQESMKKLEERASKATETALKEATHAQRMVKALDQVNKARVDGNNFLKEKQRKDLKKIEGLELVGGVPVEYYEGLEQEADQLKEGDIQGLLVAVAPEHPEIGQGS